GRHLTRVVVDGLIRLHSDQEAVAIERRILQGVFERLVALLLWNHVEAWIAWRNHKRNDVMHDLPIAWPGLRELHVLVLGKVGRRVEVLILVRAAGGDGVLVGN